MSDTAATAAAFTGLIDLAALGLGGKVLGASDDFFASAAWVPLLPEVNLAADDRRLSLIHI